MYSDTQQHTEQIHTNDGNFGIKDGHKNFFKCNIQKQ